MGKVMLLIILAGILLGCSSGRKYDTRAIDRIEVGQTTESEALAVAGMPLESRKLSNGTKIYEYAYGHRCPIAETSVNLMQLQFYNGVVINKFQGMYAF